MTMVNRQVPSINDFDHILATNACVEGLAFFMNFSQVQLAGGRKGVLSVREGDDPHRLAASFAKIYHLSLKHQEKLRALVTKQLEEHELEKQEKRRAGQRSASPKRGRGNGTPRLSSANRESPMARPQAYHY